MTIGEGSKAVTVDLDFDTGSSDLWGTFLLIMRALTEVFSKLLPKSIPTTGHHVYDPKSSPTAKVIPKAKWDIAYGDGSYASGVVYTV